MMFVISALCVILACCHIVSSAVVGGNSTQLAPPTTCKVTEYVLALQHMCGFESIHGLWPDPESSCSYCSSEVFSESKISSGTLSNMNKYWPTCVAGNTNHDFWDHEWSKHGTCSGMSQNDYFTEGISLFQKYSSKCSSDCYVCLTPTFGYIGVGVC